MTVLNTSFGSPFPEQVAALRLRLGNQLPTQAWDDLRHAQHDSAFVIAGAMKADLLADIAAAVDRAVIEHRSFDKFREEFMATVDKHNWRGWTGDTTEKGRAWRARVIYRTNMATSYAAGRMAQLVDGNFKFWVYKHGNAVEPRLQHLAWDGIALPPDHPFWQTHAPPNGWGCTCRIRGANTAAGILRAKGDPNKALPDGWQSPDPKTGAPRGIDKGWDYAPGASVVNEVIQRKLPGYPAPIGAALLAALPANTSRRLAVDFAKFVDETLAGPARGKVMVVGALKPEWVKALHESGVPPATAEIAVRDHAVWHSFRDAKAGRLDLSWYRDLPLHLANPEAVVLDKSDPDRPVLLLLYPSGAKAKLVVSVNYSIKKIGVMNALESGRTLNRNDIGALMGSGGILIWGKV